MNRRLPVYLLLDTSGSMNGEPIEALKNGVQLLVSTLRQDPYALETAYISVIGFGGGASLLLPLTELAAFQPPILLARGDTQLGAALELLARQIAQEVRKTTDDEKGDWKPIVFLMTDGAPTDNWRRGLDAIRVSGVQIIACGVGGLVDKDVLAEITESVVLLDTADPSTIKSFFKWVSASIAASSKKLERTGGDFGGLQDLPPPPKEINIL